MTTSAKDRLFAELRAAERNRFFFGKRLDVPHFDLEQTYHRRQQALINRLSLGKGVLCGLSLRVEGDRLYLGPGVAVDGLGREITVPHTVEIDPWSEAAGHMCCDDPSPRSRDIDHTVTVFLCYRECLSDHQPAMVDDCAGAPSCEAGKVVETYHIELRDGAPYPREPSRACRALGEADSSLSREERIAARRTKICEALNEDCAVDEESACVPLATVELRGGGRIGALTVCPVRPRLYSNETLLELILCLADRIEECCDKNSAPAPRESFRVAAVRWLASGTDGSVYPLRSELPLRAEVPVNREIGEIDIEFTSNVDLETVHPRKENTRSTAYNIRIEYKQDGSLVRGVAGLIDARTIRFRSRDTFQRGSYEMTLVANPSASGTPTPLADMSGNRLDGEPIGLPSGDAVEGGNFVVKFDVV